MIGPHGRTALLPATARQYDATPVIDVCCRVCGIDPLEPRTHSRSHLSHACEESVSVNLVVSVGFIVAYQHSVFVMAMFAQPLLAQVRHDLDPCWHANSKLVWQKVPSKSVYLSRQQGSANQAAQSFP